jgi:hypothetical protein
MIAIFKYVTLIHFVFDPHPSSSYQVDHPIEQTTVTPATDNLIYFPPRVRATLDY